VAGRREEILLGETGRGPEVRAPELLELRRLPLPQTIGVGERLDDPSIDRETFEPAEAEERDACGDFRTHARQGLEFGEQSRRI